MKEKEMLTTITSTSLILLREGFESILLTGLILSSLPDRYRLQIYFNFIATWVLTLVAGWFAVGWLFDKIENIEHILLLSSGFILIYIYFHSKAIFEHAKEHAATLSTQNWLFIHFTIFLIVFREALESTVFFGSNIFNDPTGVIKGLLFGIPLLIVLLVLFYTYGKSFINKIMFKYIGFLILALGIYYVYSGMEELLFG